MAKVSVLMPHPELRELAISLIAQYPRIEPIAIEYVQTGQISERARMLEREGCDLIVARGLQARIARDSVRIPVIEMRASTQELASQVLEMKHILSKAGQRPCIGIIGFFNMFHSTERFSEILGVDLRVYVATDIEQYAFLVDRARGEGCTGVIGGEQVGQRAMQLGLAYRFLSMGEESIREAFEAASLLGYSIGLILLSCLLFITSTHSRRRYYIGNAVSTGVFTVAGVALSVWSHIQLEAYKAEFLKLDFDSLQFFSEMMETPYIDSTFWFDAHYAVFGLVLLACLLLVVNFIWKHGLMRAEKRLIEDGKKVSA